MAITSEHRAAVKEAEHIIRQHKKYGGMLNFYNQYSEPIKYTSALITGSAIPMIASALAQETQILFFSKLLVNTDVLTKTYFPNMMVSGFWGAFAGDWVYQNILRKKSIS